MDTIFDWVTMAIFAGLVVLFLQRSVADTPTDRVIEYLPPAVGCAVANYLGNHDYEPFSIALILGVLGYIWYILKPLAK